MSCLLSISSVVSCSLSLSLKQWIPDGENQGDRCRLNVWGAYGNQNLRDRMTMYELWTAGEILAGMCARFDKAGKYEHLGECKRLD